MAENDSVVGIAEIKMGAHPGRMVAYGLGSCVAVTLYDRVRKKGGLAHVMLPSSRMGAAVPVPGKYADTAIESLLEFLAAEGIKPGDLEAKLVGGANMFVAISQQAVPIGMRNVSSVRDKLREKRIPVRGEDVGGNQGRTMYFFLQDGRVEIRKLNEPNLVI